MALTIKTVLLGFLGEDILTSKALGWYSLDRVMKQKFDQFESNFKFSGFTQVFRVKPWLFHLQFNQKNMISLLLASVMASPIASLDHIETITSSGSVEGKIIAAVAIVGGLALCFLGYRLFRFTLFIAGYILFSNLTFLALARLEPSNGYPARELVYLLAPIGLGILGGFLAYKLYRIGLSIIGFLGGAALAITILSFKDNGIIDSDTGRLLIIVAVGIVGAIVIQFIQKPVIVISTAIAGSYAFFFGIDVFIQTGFSQAVQRFAGGAQTSLGTFERSSSTAVIGMCAGVLILAIIGSVSQFRTFNGFDHRSRYKSY